jgi:hypothetical protein
VSEQHHGDLTWEQYLDVLETAVLTIDTEVLTGHSPGWLDAKVPQGPIPTPLRVRSQVLLALLHDVTERTQLQRDDLAAELAAMPHQRPIDHAHSASLGASIDLIG